VSGARAVPITVLTGFLGTGKTTLLNRLLKHPDLADTAVLINEFGEIGLDHLLVERLDGDTVLLNAGCLCCTVRGDLLRTLESLAARIDAGQPCRRVVIETTGLADPAPILQTLMVTPVTARRFRLDGVVTLVDAVNGAATLDAQPEAVRQVAVADRLVLTKADIASAEATSALLARLGALNPGAPLRVVTQGEVEPGFLLHAGPYDPAARPTEVQSWIDAEAWARHDDDNGHGHGHGDGHHHDPNRHDARIQAFCLTFDAPIPLAGLASWLEMMVATRGEALLRVKGLLNLQGGDRPVVLHAVQHVFHPTVQLTGWPHGDDRRSRIVFILRDLPRAAVEDSLRAFLAAAESPQPVAAA